MRKKILSSDSTPAPTRPSWLDVSSLATVLVTSETEKHPVENAFDSQRGPGRSYWMAREPGAQTIILEFDEPQSIREVTLEVEETEVSRRQEITLSMSIDAGRSYQELFRQEYNFSPPGTTFQREEWRLHADRVTHLRLWIQPDMGGIPCEAKLTTLAFQ